MTSKVKFVYDDYIMVKEYFENNHDNTSSRIAKELGVNINRVNYYLNLYLSLKANYMGDEITPPSSPFKYKKTIRNVITRNVNPLELYINDVYVGEFKNVRCLEVHLGLTIKKSYRDDMKFSGFSIFKSRRLNKEIKIIKL